MGRSLPVLNFPALAGTLGSIQQQVSQFFTPPSTALHRTTAEQSMISNPISSP
jgi:hypothetical protein